MRTLTGVNLEDGVAPSEPLRIRHFSVSSLMRASSLEVTELRQVLRALEVTSEDRVVFTEPDGRFFLQNLTVGVSVEIGLPTTHLLMSLDGRPQAYMHGRVSITADKKDVEIKTARLPRVTGRMVWEDTCEPLVGTFHTIFRNRSKLNDSMNGPGRAPIRGAIMASDLERAITDADGGVRIAARQGPMQVLANDCALSEFELPEEPTSVDAPFELRPAPGATLEVLAHRGSGTNPWGVRACASRGKNRPSRARASLVHDASSRCPNCCT